MSCLERTKARWIEKLTFQSPRLRQVADGVLAAVIVTAVLVSCGDDTAAGTDQTDTDIAPGETTEDTAPGNDASDADEHPEEKSEAFPEEKSEAFPAEDVEPLDGRIPDDGVAIAGASGLTTADVDMSSKSDLSAGTSDGSLASSDLGPVQGDLYTYWDGDELRQVWLQSDVQANPDGSVTARNGDDAVASASNGGSLVFRDQSGAFMTLSGGVVVLLDPDWTSEQVKAFFDSNGIPMNSVTAMDGFTNGFIVAAGPGFASLNLANALAGQEGVIISTPNWRMEVTTR